MAMAPRPVAAPPHQRPVASPRTPSQQAFLQPQPADNDRSSGELRALDCNLASLCDHIQMEGFNSGAFSDLVVEAMGSSYRLHRLILSRSSYFRNMLHGPWKEADSPTVVLHIDDSNVNSEAIAVALAYLYGHHPKLNDNNAFRVLAAASFLDLQDLCAICTDFIISELWTSNFLAYQVFAESQDYGIYGERVRNACWGYLCQSAYKELREILPKLSSQTLHSLLTSDELWVPNEEKRFELAFYTLLAKAAMAEAEHSGPDNSSSDNVENLGSPKIMSSGHQQMESTLQNTRTQENSESLKVAHNVFSEFADCVVSLHTDVPYMRSVQERGASRSHQGGDPRYSLNIDQSLSSSSSTDANAIRASYSHAESSNGIENAKMGRSEAATEGPSGESPSSQLNTGIWLSRESRESFLENPLNGAMPNDWGRCNVPIWGGRTVGRRQIKNSSGTPATRDEEYDTFLNIFEGGSLLYCNMSFEALLNVRKQLEEFGFPCNAVNDGLWLQMLLCHRVQAIVAETCRNCCLANNTCQCRQANGYSNGSSQVVYYRQENDRSSANTMGNVYAAEAEGSGLFGHARVHVRGAIDGLAGIGRGTAYVQGDGLTALVGLSQGNNIVHVRTEQTERVYEDPTGRFAGTSSSNANGVPVQVLESQEYPLGLEWENSEGSSISLDLKTPLRHFPPFRFGVAFEDVHRLTDGQVRHSPEVFYAGSLWKVSVQAFSDEDPQGRRTLGLFLHRRKAEMADSFRKVHFFIDSREKVTARYQLICPSKREVMVFGSFKQAGTLLPKAPKGWGWRTALLFDELADLLQAGTLRIAAVVQIV